MPTKQIPMIAPDGTPGMVDAESAQQAADKGYKPGMVMYSPEGAKGIVGFDNLKQAMAKGYKSEAQTSGSGDVPANSQNNAGIVSTPLRFLQGAGTSLAGIVKGIAGATQESPAQQAISGAIPGGAVGNLAYNLIAKPQIAQGQQAVQALQQGNVASGVQHAFAATNPAASMVSGALDAAQPDITSGNYAGAAGSLAGAGAAAYLGAKAIKGAAAETPVSGQNYTPTQGAAFSGLVSRGTGMGKNFFPKEVTQGALSDIRQTLADNPDLAAAATGKGVSPENSYGAAQGAIQKTLDRLESQHSPVLQQFANEPANVSSIQSAVEGALPKSLDKFAPEDRAALQDLSDRVGKVDTLQGLNDLRQYLNTEASPTYRANRAVSGAVDKAYANAADAARNAYYDQLQNVSGMDFAPLKQRESALITTKEALGSNSSSLAAKQAQSEEPQNARVMIGNALSGAGAIKAGPVAGLARLIAEKGLKIEPMTQTQYLVRRAFDKLPPGSVTQVGGKVSAAPRLGPGSSLAQK